MSIDIRKQSGVISVTSGTNIPKFYFGATGKFNTVNGNDYLIFIGGDSYTILLTNLMINGQSPSSVAEANVLLTAVFLDANSSSGGSALWYLVYTALLNQSGTDAPVATVLGSNTIGNIVWTYEGVGIYVATLTGAFPTAKTLLLTSNQNSNANTLYFLNDYDQPDQVGFISVDFVGSNVDGLINAPVEIRVYP